MNPKHISIIMDGNGRFAEERHKIRSWGHLEGANRVEELVDACLDRGIAYLSLFAFSTENWKRPTQEIKAIMRIFVFFCRKFAAKLIKKEVALHIIGDLTRLDEKTREVLLQTKAQTAGGKRLKLILAVNYGGRQEIIRAVQKMIEARPENYTEEEFARHLDTYGIPDPDLLIRTSGEQRISNFMLWQLAYTEFYFVNKHFPEFYSQDLEQAIEAYKKRSRRFGDVKTSELRSKNEK